MKIALIQSPREDFFTTPQRHYPLGLLTLADAIKDLEVNVSCLDLLSRGGRHTLPVPDNFHPASQYFFMDHGPLSSFYQYYRFGMQDKDIQSLFKDRHYDIYALSCNFYTYSSTVSRCAKIIRKLHPDAIIVAGGQAVNPDHIKTWKDPIFDHVIAGEGDLAFRQLVISYMEGSTPPRELLCTPMDTLPRSQQDLDLLAADSYKIGGKPSIMVETTRGCPMGCSFCCVAKTFGSKLRKRPVRDILELMKTAYKKGVRAFDIEDDNFTLDRNHCRRLLTSILNEFNGNISLYAMNGISAAHVDKELLQLMKNAGFRLLNLSVATVSSHVLNSIHRSINTVDVQTACDLAWDLNINTMVHFIAGLPEQTLEEMVSTLLFISRLHAVPGISPFYYIPGMGTKTPNIPALAEDARLSRFFPATDRWNELDLITLFRLTRWIAYLKKVLRENGQDQISFKNIDTAFPQDAILCRLVENGELIGIGNKNKLFTYENSPRVMKLFLNAFSETEILC